MQGPKSDQAKTSVPDQNRRKAIKKIAVGVGVVAGCSVLPEKWTKPIIGQIVLPAHAETSAEVQKTAPEEKTAAPTDSGDGTFNTSETFNISYATKSGGKQFAWLPKTGSSYGGPIKFVFGNSCGELNVPDAAVTHGADGNNSNYNQAYYFSGTDFQPGAEEYNAGRASIFGPPGCGAGTVTIFYNK
jgi:hypothetical protein